MFGGIDQLETLDVPTPAADQAEVVAFATGQQAMLDFADVDM